MLSKSICHLNIFDKSFPNMASDEGIDDAEQLRLLALQSMVRRSKPNNSYHKTDEIDDQDILLLRAAALKTIVHKNNSQTSLLIDEDDEPLKVRDLNGKRSYETPSLRSKKLMKLEQNMSNKHLNSLKDKSIIERYKKSLEASKKKNNCKNKPEVESKLAANSSKNNVKKIVKNGSIQLSNLDSENIDETLVLHITFSSSDSSDDSSCEYDSNYKNEVHDSVKYNSKQNLTKSVELRSLEDKKNSDSVTKYMQKLTGLMKHCESELKERNQQMTILLDAYEKYKNHSQTLCSIIETMKTVRDELSKFCCVKTTDH